MSGEMHNRTIKLMAADFFSLGESVELTFSDKD